MKQETYLVSNYANKSALWEHLETAIRSLNAGSERPVPIPYIRWRAALGKDLPARENYCCTVKLTLAVCDTPPPDAVT